MKRQFLQHFGVIAALLLGVLASGCHDQLTNPEQIVGSGILVLQPRSVAAFSGIQVKGIGKVVIKQDTVQSLRIEADDNIVDLVTTTVANGLLVVGLQPGSYSNVTINVYASMKNIDRLESMGTAEFLTTGPIHTDAITCRITGVGKITLAGTAGDQTIEVTGTGDVHNFDFVSTRCSALISGVGTLEVHATQQLDAVVSGAGSIVFAGNPPVVHQTVSGIGSIKPR